jgi:hypothetical protein
MSLLNEVMPVYDFNEVHGITIRASAERVFQAIHEVSIAEMPVAGLLFTIRDLPSRLSGAEKRTSARPVLDDALNAGFIPLGGTPPHELAVGVIGRFWELRGQSIRRLKDRDEFISFADPGYARAAMDFRIEPAGTDRVRLTTETRIHIPVRAARRKFARYWLVVHPSSALIRMVWLRAIARRAEDPRPR